VDFGGKKEKGKDPVVSRACLLYHLCVRGRNIFIIPRFLSLTTVMLIAERESV